MVGYDDNIPSVRINNLYYGIEFFSKSDFTIYSADYEETLTGISYTGLRLQIPVVVDNKVNGSVGDWLLTADKVNFLIVSNSEFKMRFKKIKNKR